MTAKNIDDIYQFLLGVAYQKKVLIFNQIVYRTLELAKEIAVDDKSCPIPINLIKEYQPIIPIIGDLKFILANIYRILEKREEFLHKKLELCLNELNVHRLAVIQFAEINQNTARMMSQAGINDAARSMALVSKLEVEVASRIKSIFLTDEIQIASWKSLVDASFALISDPMFIQKRPNIDYEEAAQIQKKMRLTIENIFDKPCAVFENDSSASIQFFGSKLQKQSRIIDSTPHSSHSPSQFDSGNISEFLPLLSFADTSSMRDIDLLASSHSSSLESMIDKIEYSPEFKSGDDVLDISSNILDQNIDMDALVSAPILCNYEFQSQPSNLDISVSLSSDKIFNRAEKVEAVLDAQSDSLSPQILQESLENSINLIPKKSSSGDKSNSTEKSTASKISSDDSYGDENVENQFEYSIIRIKN